MGEETDEVMFQEVMGKLGITENSKTVCGEDALGKEEIIQFLSEPIEMLIKGSIHLIGITFITIICRGIAGFNGIQSW